MQRDASRARSPPSSSAASSRGVKCSPAVGAATAPSSAGEDGLVVGAVARVAAARALDIGRQRHAAVSARAPPSARRRRDRSASAMSPSGVLLRDLGGEVVAEGDPVAGLAAAWPPWRRRASRPPPRSRCSVTSTARRAAPSQEPRRDDPRVVDHQQIARARAARAGRARAGRSSRLGDDQQPRRVARLDRPAGDQLPRQLEIEVVDAHGAALIAGRGGKSPAGGGSSL